MAIDETRLLEPLAGAGGDILAIARRTVRAFVADRRERAGLPVFDDDLPW